jgi:hypothetical protein
MKDSGCRNLECAFPQLNKGIARTECENANESLPTRVSIKVIFTEVGGWSLEGSPKCHGAFSNPTEAVMVGEILALLLWVAVLIFVFQSLFQEIRILALETLGNKIAV